MKARQLLSLPRGGSGFLGGLWNRAGGVWQHTFAVQPRPPEWLVLGSGALALLVVVSAWSWPRARTVVTIVHEAGHVIIALITGQRQVRVRVYRDTAGETVSYGPRTGVGVALTAAAGYPAPSAVGLGAAILLTIDHLTGMLLLGLALLIALAFAVRNLYGMLAVLVTAGTVAGVCLYASPEVQAGFGYAMTWFLLIGGVRPVVELHDRRKRGRDLRTDADQLARLTHMPGGAWVAIFGIFALAALGISARWLVG